MTRLLLGVVVGEVDPRTAGAALATNGPSFGCAYVIFTIIKTSIADYVHRTTDHNPSAQQPFDIVYFPFRSSLFLGTSQVSTSACACPQSHVECMRAPAVCYFAAVVSEPSADISVMIFICTE